MLPPLRKRFVNFFNHTELAKVSSQTCNYLENGDLGPVDPDSPHGAMNTEDASVIVKTMYATRNCRLGQLGRWQGDYQAGQTGGQEVPANDQNHPQLSRFEAH